MCGRSSNGVAVVMMVAHRISHASEAVEGCQWRRKQKGKV
jgi:hypothetical protein